jgi:hypothetical protein
MIRRANSHSRLQRGRMKSKRAALPKPASFTDESWQEKINLAKQVRADRQKARAGKSPLFVTVRSLPQSPSPD